MNFGGEGSTQLASEEELLENDSRWELARRIANHPSLSRATQLRNILLYLVRQSILRPGEPVEDLEIAQRVLGRRSDFDPMDDSIVRVQMAHLRKRLKQYFATDGQHEDLVISIALGSYEPIFSHRSIAKATLPSTLESGLLAENWMDRPDDPGLRLTSPSPQPESKERMGGRTALRWSAAASLLALCLGTFVGFHLRPAESADRRAPDVSNSVVRQIFAPGANVNVVLADTSLVTLQTTIHSDISIAEYLDPRYPDNVLEANPNPVVRSQLTALTHSRYTSLNDADVVSTCSYWGAILGAKVDVRYARYMHVRDFQEGNFVIVGSRRGNPWTSLFEPSLNFFFEEDPATHIFHLRNRNPRPGEPNTYEPAWGKGGSNVGYVDIALLPNLGGTGSVLLLNGFTIETNEAAAHLILNKDLSPVLSHALGHLSAASKFELLLRVRSVDKSELGWEIVAMRTSGS